MRTERAMTTRKAAKKVKALDPMGVPVSAVMTKRVKTVRPDTSLDVAMDLMMAKDIGHLPVIDEAGRLVGILSKTDVVRRYFIDGDTEASEVRVSEGKGVNYSPAGFHEDTIINRTVAEVMSRKVRTVSDSAPLVEAAISMSKFRVHGLPVVSAKNNLVGFLSTFDIVDWVAAS
ncbi:MAG: CBS domain-containing protein [Myxococcota bacterium]